MISYAITNIPPSVSPHLALVVHRIVRAAEPAREAVLEEVGVRVADVLHDRVHEETDGEFVLRGVGGVGEHALKDRGDRRTLIGTVAFCRSREGIDNDLVGELAHLLRLGAEQIDVLLEGNLAHFFSFLRELLLSFTRSFFFSRNFYFFRFSIINSDQLALPPAFLIFVGSLKPKINGRALR